MTPWVKTCTEALKHTHDTAKYIGHMVERGALSIQKGKEVMQSGIDMWQSLLVELFRDDLGLMGVRLAVYKICDDVVRIEPLVLP